jgi:hypothetical protein
MRRLQRCDRTGALRCAKVASVRTVCCLCTDDVLTWHNRLSAPVSNVRVGVCRIDPLLVVSVLALAITARTTLRSGWLFRGSKDGRKVQLDALFIFLLSYESDLSSHLLCIAMFWHGRMYMSPHFFNIFAHTNWPMQRVHANPMAQWPHMGGVPVSTRRD